MKVTVTFGDTAVVVPCKPGWNVRDLIEQATRRYRRILEQHGQAPMKTHHLEYTDGGILDMDDLLTDLVEDRDKLVAVLEDGPRGGTNSPGDSISNGYASSAPSPAPSPDPLPYFPHLDYREPIRGEIEVNEDVLKANTPLLVRSSSDSALAPPLSTLAPPLSTTPATMPATDDSSNGSPLPEVNNVLRGALDRLRTENPSAKMSQVNFSTLTRPVDFPGDWGPLGIHVVPYCSSLSGRTLGLHIKGIEDGGRAQREALFQEDECIVQINGAPLQDKTFAQSQEVFRQAMATPSVRLELLPVANKPSYEKSVIGQLFAADGRESPATTTARAKSPAVARARPADAQESRPGGRQEIRLPETRAKSSEPAVQLLPSGPEAPERRSPSPTTPRSPLPGRSPAIPNVTSRRGGKRVKIDLRKGPEGLGFTVVTRDSSLHGPGPILVKNILPRGAAIKDGRLQPGDRILEVNGVDMMGRSQEELVAMLRSTRLGESVSVVVARQEDLFLPRELKGEDGGSGGLVLEDGREQLMYEVPLNETGSAGLGVSLKGNKSRETGEDLGIFIKSIIHGGAAYKDARLSVNDQLIAVNGESLLGRSNHAAMEALRHSMSSEGNSRGTIQLVVLRAPRQTSSANPPLPDAARHGSAHFQPAHDSQDPRGHGGNQGAPWRSEGPGHARSHSHGDVASYPAALSNGNYGNYDNYDDDYDHDDLDRSFPPPPSPGSVEELSRDPPPDPSRHSDFQRTPFHPEDQVPYDRGNVPRNRASKSMDLVADESNLGALVERRDDPSAGGALGPTLGLMKSSSLESLQTAVSEAQQSRIQAQVPFHRPRPNMVRGRSCNQSFRIAIDKSYEGPSEDDDDLSEQSSGRDTPASGSSRQELDVDDGAKKKKKTKGKKKEKKSKGKKKADEPAEDPEKKTKRRGFGLLRFGKKKDDRSKEAAKGSKVKLEALNEEEQERIPDSRDGLLLNSAPFPNVEDDDSDPNYARINHFLPPPSPQTFVSRTPSPAAPVAAAVSAEELDGLYAKVNKQRLPAYQQSQADSDQRLQGRRDQQHQQPRAAPGYEELDSARRRVLDHDPHRMAPREPRPAPQYDDRERQHPTQARRDRYDYPAPARDPAHYDEPPLPRGPLPQAGTHHQRGAGQQQQQQRRHYEAFGARPDGGYRQASPERYGYGDKRQPDPRRKNPAIGAV
ncbi:par-3 family cell polarity regulator beta a [Nelusetta ayraudi]|uniref:par-3 family cell polarity regulator beta a n=1 Tax=Nelusetta ayraudi TaxID=303726 RepID=UPI003F6E7C1B